MNQVLVPAEKTSLICEPQPGGSQHIYFFILSSFWLSFILRYHYHFFYHLRIHCHFFIIFKFIIIFFISILHLRGQLESL